MNESLNMLKTEEGQLNAVFACFGSAAQHAQLFETALRDFFLAYKTLLNPQMSAEEVQEAIAADEKKTMGKLLHNLKQKVRFNEWDIEAYIMKSLDVRNFLMHRFFLDRDAQFKTEGGRMALIRELLDIQEHLRGAGGLVGGMRVAMVSAMKPGSKETKDDSEVVCSIDVDLPEPTNGRVN